MPARTIVPTPGRSGSSRFAKLLGGSARTKSADRETVVASQTRERAILIVEEGCILLESVLPSGRRQVLGFRFPGDMLCTAFVSNLPNGMAQALRNVRFLKVQHRAIRDQAARSPQLGRAMAGLAATQAERANLHNLVLGQLNRQERVATFLLELALRTGTRVGEGVVMPLPMTRNHIADYLGLNVDTVSRIISAFKADGIIRLPAPGGVEVPDFAALEAQTPLSDALRALYREDEQSDVDTFFARLGAQKSGYDHGGIFGPIPLWNAIDPRDQGT
ncbi:MAG: hypothetical protein D6773_07130, partial [Alphaproteobacteria bacterium]